MRGCTDCEHLKREQAAKGRTFFRCGYPGENQGRVIALVPDWCTAAQVWIAPAWCEKGGENGEVDA